jgi:hypothetical protein
MLGDCLFANEIHRSDDEFIAIIARTLGYHFLRI